MTSKNQPTFQRSPHDKENPFAQISRDLLRDESISPECRWLISYLLCNKEGWVIKIEQIVNHLKGHRNCGESRVYKMINEAIAAGYMQREAYYEKNLKRYRYFVSESKSFSNNFSDTSLPEVPANDTVKKEHIEEYKSKPKDEHSADASALASYFLSKVKEKKTDFTKTVSPSWVKNSEKILKIRSKQEIGKIIEFALNHDFWMSKCLTPEKILKHLDALEIDMNNKGKKSPLASNKQKVMEKFKNGEKYNGAECLINDEGIAFQRGQKLRHLKFKEHGFIDQLNKILYEDFGIRESL